jgi:murein DD-endopeptidase MepM/ murein hydrolase activator NlpD
VSRSARPLRVISATAALAGLGLLIWWFTVGQAAAPGPAAIPAAISAGTATVAPADAAPSERTPTGTAIPTPIPSPTPVPTALPFSEAVRLGDLFEVLSTPLPDCGLLGNDNIVAGTVTLTCIEDWATVPVVAAASGRVVNVVRAPVAGLDNVGPSAVWSWAEQAELGPHVVVDHGPLGGSANTQTVYARLATIEDGISVGALISGGEPLGAVAGPSASLQFSVWTNNERQDGVRVLADGPSAEEQRAVAQALGDVIASPTDERCPLVLSSGSLPGAPRTYRNGTHRGIDFGCGTADRSGYSIADGTVVYLVNDYEDSSVAEREALLEQASIAGFTPHWTLVMLYGNVVVIDHGEIPGAGRVVTISAHLEEIDPSISIGGRVLRGQRLGELGNRGTNASAEGLRGASDPSLHLHWELFIDNWYLGSGLDAGTTVEVIAMALCGAAKTAGCPA